MRIILCLPMIFIFIGSLATERTDTVNSKLSLTGNLSLNSNGIASIPAFSLGKPALIASFALQKKRFSYDPVVAYGLDLRPWIIDNWVHYRPVYGTKFELRAGVDFSMFFSEYDEGDYKILQGQQYITFEIAGFYKFNPRNSLGLMYWSDNGQGHGTIKGSFYNIIWDMVEIKAGRSLRFAANVQFFYLDYTGENDGLFISPKISAALRNIPVSVFFQATQAIVSNVEPFPGFRWNVGAAYIF